VAGLGGELVVGEVVKAGRVFGRAAGDQRLALVGGTAEAVDIAGARVGCRQASECPGPDERKSMGGVLNCTGREAQGFRRACVSGVLVGEHAQDVGDGVVVACRLGEADGQQLVALGCCYL
jgi:hypothetical protein